MQKIKYTGDPIKDVVKEINYAKKWVAERVSRKMHDRLLLTYKKIIDFFYYDYQPQFYVRHGMESAWEPGEKSLSNGRKYIGKVYLNAGVNLYLGAEFKQPKGIGDIFDGGLDFVPRNMSIDPPYSLGDDAGTVLDMVLNGKRFPWGKESLFCALIEDDDLGVMTGEPYGILEDIANSDILLNKFYEEAIKECNKENNFLYCVVE